ncbi:hypothetical protein AVEN_203569-1 [Araneus ventricosus]|uniref:Uncharacterized protein n=1 Tax=Araneus ventricosus TaxID=182803 RepID=A0A4Y2FRS7_ARAVE|nr:hypothetical protein AVEN_203569-1 [Araneus ventricosus]
MECLEHGKENPFVKVENLSNLEQMILNGGIQKNLKSKTQSFDSNLRPRCEGKPREDERGGGGKMKSIKINETGFSRILIHFLPSFIPGFDLEELQSEVGLD